MPTPRLKSGGTAAEIMTERKDPYEVLGVLRNATDQDIKSAYRKMALNVIIDVRYHPDKNANHPKAADMFKEVTFSYTILSDPDKRRQFDTSGFKAVDSENQDLELDLSSLGAMNTMFAALFSQLGVPIKTSDDCLSDLLEEALNGVVSTLSIPLGQPVRRKVDKQCAHFYSVTITGEEAQAGFVCPVHSIDKSKFKLLYFDQEDNGGLRLALQPKRFKNTNFGNLPTSSGAMNDNFLIVERIMRFDKLSTFLER